jgi:hypothetical protein
MGELMLLREFEAAQARAHEAMDLLVTKGVSVSSFMTSGWPGVDSVKVVGRLYHPHPHGYAMIILPVWYGHGPLYLDSPVLADLVAFRVDQPDRWFYRDGKPGLVLGNESLDHAITTATPITLFETPLAWLQGGCDGAVILEDAEGRRERGRMAAAWSSAA